MPRHIAVAIPAYTGMVHLGTMRALIADMVALMQRGDRFTILDECGNGIIADARALIVAKFLASDCTDLFFLDWDVIWQAGAMVRLIDAPVDFCAAVYPQRKDPISFPVQYIPERPELWADPETGLLEVAGVAAGFMRCSRTMLERMVGLYRRTEFFCEKAPDQRAWALFDSWWDGKVKYGEDYSFCRRWREIGGKVWVDPEIKMGHVGNKTFFGTFGEWLRNR